MICANPDCGKEFDQFGQKKYCSSRCRQNTWQNRSSRENREFLTRGKTYNCPYCGKDFIPHRRINQTCCSDKCSKRFYKEKQREKIDKTRPCVQCGTFFTPEYSHKKYCSKKCRNGANKDPLSYQKYKKKHLATAKLWKAKNGRKLKLYRENRREKERVTGMARHDRYVATLHDSYVKSLIAQNTKIRQANVPCQLVDLKRMQLKFKRYIK